MSRHKFFQGLLVCLSWVILASGCGAGNDRAVLHADGDIARGDELLRYFEATHPGKEVIVFERADLNNDQTDDLIVIFRESKEKNSMLVVMDLAGSYQCTNEVPAPVSNQTIQIRDIDQRPPVEFIVQGTKGASFGYAIYRVEGLLLEDLFGEGMEDCC